VLLFRLEVSNQFVSPGGHQDTINAGPERLHRFSLLTQKPLPQKVKNKRFPLVWLAVTSCHPSDVCDMSSVNILSVVGGEDTEGSAVVIVMCQHAAWQELPVSSEELARLLLYFHQSLQ